MITMRETLIKIEVKSIEEAIETIEKVNKAMMNSSSPSSSKLEITVSN